MTHADHQPGRSDCPGHLTVTMHLARRRGVYTVYRCDQCQWTNAPRRRQRGRQRTDRQPMSQQTPEIKAMRLRYGANLKGGLPNYGSLGSSMEIELTVDDEISPDQVLQMSPVWQKVVDHLVEAEQARKAARYLGPHNSPQPQSAAAAPRAARPPEPTADDYDPEPEHREQPPEPPARNRNGNGSGPPARGGGQRDDRPRNGKQLLGWASSHGQYEALRKLGKQYSDRGRIVDWSDDMVQWAYNDLSRPVGAGWGDGRN